MVPNRRKQQKPKLEVTQLPWIAIGIDYVFETKKKFRAGTIAQSFSLID